MSARSDIRALLLADSTVSSLLGARIKSDLVAPGTALPYAIESVPSDPPLPHISGRSGLRRMLITYTVWASSRLGSMQAADAIEGALDNFTGTTGSTYVESSALVMRRDTFSPPSAGDEAATYGTVLDFEVWTT